MSGQPTGHRSGGRAGRQAARKASVPDRVAFITRTMTPFQVLAEEGLTLIEDNAETILEKVGIEFRETPDALQRFGAAGAQVEGERVRFPRGLARELVKTAPRDFIQHARNPANDVHILSLIHI